MDGWLYIQEYRMTCQILLQMFQLRLTMLGNDRIVGKVVTQVTNFGEKASSSNIVNLANLEPTGCSTFVQGFFIPNSHTSFVIANVIALYKYNEAYISIIDLF